MMRNVRLGMLAVGLFAVVLPLLGSRTAAAKEYMVAGNKPDNLSLIDLAQRKVVRHYKIPAGGPPFSMNVSPDGKIVYVLCNDNKSISGIDLDSGKEVFRAHFPVDGMQIQSVGGMTMSPDGKELFVEQSLTRLLSDQYQVMPTRMAVYRTDAGLHAKPVRIFATPRRIAELVPSSDGKIIYGLGWDLYAFDANSGKILKTYKVLNWNRPHAGPPDLLNFWPMYEQNGIFSTPYFYSRTDLPADNPESQKTGLLTLDLKTGEFRMTDFENTSAIIFSSVISPKDHNEAFGTYITLSRIRLGSAPKLEKRVDLDHTHYVIDISADGSEVYVGGAVSSIGVYSTKTLKRLATISLPGDGDMGVGLMRVFSRP